MKHRFKVILAISFLALTGQSFALHSQDRAKERKEYTQQSKKELDKKASKAARKEAKQLAKEGWQTAPGAMPLEKQLDRSYIMQMETTSDYSPAYIMGEGMSVGGSYDAAKTQALALAKQQVASAMESEIASIVNTEIANSQLAGQDAASIAETVQKSKSIFTQHLGRVITVVECYRTLPNQNKEVLLRIAYSATDANNIAKEAVRDELRVKLDSLGK